MKVDYNSMSDFEINKAVSMIVDFGDFGDFGDLACFANDEREVVYICEVDGAYSMNHVGDFDPCNNPSDAWPIIIEHGICIEKRSRLTDFWVAITWHQISGNEYRPIHQHIDKKPLRAAMIVFLMMNEQ